MNTKAPALYRSLFSKTRLAVLALLYGRTDIAFYTKQILNAVNAGSGTVQRELQNMTYAGIITRQVKGRRVYYRANEKCPIFNELKNLAASMAIPEPEVIPVKTESPLDSRFPISPARLAAFCRKYHIKKLSLFGSVLRDDFRPDSDIDVLVEFEKDHAPGFGIITMQDELTGSTGHPVDIRTTADLSRYFRGSVVREARVKYAKTQP